MEVLHGTSQPGGFLPRFYLESHALFSNPVDDDVRQYRGRTYESGGGMVDMHEPGEVSCCLRQRGPAVLQGVFLDPGVIEIAARELGSAGVPHFTAGAVYDASSFAALFSFHRSLRDGCAPLEQQTRFAEALRQVLERLGEHPPAEPKRDKPAVARAREYLHAHWSEEVSLDELSRASFTSKYHLVRVFKDVVGVPPHEYLRHVRVAHAKRMLAEGRSIGQTAFACGFADQAHLTRTFKTAVGVTPGRYASAVRSRYVSSAAADGVPA